MSFISLRSKSANSQTFFNVTSTVIRTGVAFFTMPLFTRLLGTAQYGLYSIYISWYNIIICFISLGCGQGLATGMYKYKDDYYRFRSSILLGGTVMCGFVTIIAVVVYLLFSSRINYPYWIFLLLFIEASASFVASFVGSAWTYEKKAGRNFVLSMATLLSTTGLSIILITQWSGKQEELYIARVLGVALPSILISIFVWLLVFLQRPAGYDKEYWTYSFSFGIPLIFHTLSHQVLSSSDRIMMQYFGISDSAIGIYSFYYTFVAILGMILTALNNSFIPFLYEDLDKKDYNAINPRVKNLTQIFVALSCGFILLSREVSKVFANEQYWSGMPIMPIILMIMYCIFVYQQPVNYEFFKSKPRIIAYCTAGAAVVNIILNAVFIPQWGMYGAAIATLLSYVILAIAHIIVVTKWKEEKYPLTWKPIVHGLIPICIACVLYYVFADMWIIRWTVAVCIGIYLVYSIYKRKTIF